MKYISIENSKEITIIIEKSRFIANALQIKNTFQAHNFIKDINQKYKNATHNCWAYRVYENERELFNYSDNKEPSGTAGRRILGVIEKYNLYNVAIVVTRYFGGIKLGIRGLIDAYSQVAEEVIKNSQLVTYKPFLIYEIYCDYSNFSHIQRMISKDPNVSIIESKFEEIVFLKLKIAEEYENNILNILKNRTLKLDFIEKSDYPIQQSV